MKVERATSSSAGEALRAYYDKGNCFGLRRRTPVSNKFALTQQVVLTRALQKPNIFKEGTSPEMIEALSQTMLVITHHSYSSANSAMSQGIPLRKVEK